MKDIVKEQSKQHFSHSKQLQPPQHPESGPPILLAFPFGLPLAKESFYALFEIIAHIAINNEVCVLRLRAINPQTAQCFFRRPQGVRGVTCHEGCQFGGTSATSFRISQNLAHKTKLCCLNCFNQPGSKDQFARSSCANQRRNTVEVSN